MIHGWVSSSEITLRWMQIDLTDKSTFVHVMVWCRQATSHYMSLWFTLSSFYLKPFRPKRYCPTVFPWTLLCFQQFLDTFEPECPNFHQHASSDTQGWYWNWESWNHTLRWPFWFRILAYSACPLDNWTHYWHRITKFAPSMHLVIM